jgi:hypothetical protein
LSGDGEPHEDVEGLRKGIPENELLRDENRKSRNEKPRR